MMFRSTGLILCFLLSSQAIHAQSIRFIGVETGIDFIGGEAITNDHIRGDIPVYNYYDNRSTPTLAANINKHFLGAKFEQQTKNEKFGFLLGLRYTQLSSTIKKDAGFFYYLYQQTGTTTEYFRIRELAQTSGYVGIPWEVRWYPFAKKYFRIYFVAGGEYSYRVTTKNEVTFYDELLGGYAGEIAQRTGSPGKGYGTFLLGGGFSFGKENKPHMNIEINAPVSISSSSSSLVTPTAGGGIHLQLQFPF